MTISMMCAGVLFVGSIADRLGAQNAPPTPSADVSTQGRGGPGGGPARGFPAQQRQLAPWETIDRGKLVYEINCRACHGPDLRGGEAGGPNLLRSELALTDLHGELIIPVVKQGRQTPGLASMPPIALPDNDIVAVAEFIHAVQATARGQGSPPPGPAIQLNVVVGDAKEGEAYFRTNCTACHTNESIRGIASRIPDPMQLQNAWVAGGAIGARGNGRGSTTRVTAVVTFPNGERIEGTLIRIDDFIVALTMPDGTQRSFARNADVPKVDVNDSRQAHWKLLPTYTDRDMHNVTAYLVTLK